MKYLLEAIIETAKSDPEKIALNHLATGEPKRSLCYADLVKAYSALAEILRPKVQAGDRVLIAHPTSLEFATAFLAVIAVGGIAVPVPAPRYPTSIKRISQVCKSCDPIGSLCSRDDFQQLEALGVSALITDSIKAKGDLSQPSIPDADQVAFLQYTSGSTGEPMGVMVNHKNLYAVSRSLLSFSEHDQGGRYLCCLPLSHDMGLIGLLLQALWEGGTCTLIRPETFMRRPKFVLEAIADEQIEFAGGPPFFYETCSKLTADEINSLDLSQWKGAFVGAEMIPASTLEKFAKAFAPAGFSAKAFMPCYGLAEATLLVAGTPPSEMYSERLLDDNRKRIACKHAYGDTELQIIDPQTHRKCEDGEHGEIWLTGSVVAAGYWNKPEETEVTFQAQADGDDKFWLRTGDLAYQEEGELILVGRCKEILISNGQNFYPQDLELAVQERLPPQAHIAAIALNAPDGKESISLIIESKHTDDLTMRKLGQIAQAVEKESGCLPDSIHLLEGKSFTYTTSGKLQRLELAQKIQAGLLDIQLTWTPGANETSSVDTSSEVTEANIIDFLCERVSNYLRLELTDVKPELSLLELGMDSSLSMSLMLDLEKHLGIRLPDELMLEYPTIDQIAKHCLELKATVTPV